MNTPGHKPTTTDGIVEIIDQLNNAVYLVKTEVISIQKQLTILGSRLEYLQKRIDIMVSDDK
jgi:hypothetical protein